MRPEDRCTKAIRLGSLATRCLKPLGHTGAHKGKGEQARWFMRYEWFTGDADEFVTQRTDEFMWRTKVPPGKGKGGRRDPE